MLSLLILSKLLLYTTSSNGDRGGKPFSLVHSKRWVASTVKSLQTSMQLLLHSKYLCRSFQLELLTIRNCSMAEGFRLMTANPSMSLDPITLADSSWPTCKTFASLSTFSSAMSEMCAYPATCPGKLSRTPSWSSTLWTTAFCNTAIKHHEEACIMFVSLYSQKRQ